MTTTKAGIAASLIDTNLQKVLGGLVDDIAAAVTVPGVTATAAELSANAGLPASITTTATPATGTCGVQFVFKDSAGAALAHAITGSAYFSNSTGLAFAPATSAAVLTNGAWRDDTAGYTGNFITDTTGKLGVTVTGGAATYYLSFQLPNGKIITSTALTVN